MFWALLFHLEEVTTLWESASYLFCLNIAVKPNVMHSCLFKKKKKVVSLQMLYFPAENVLNSYAICCPLLFVIFQHIGMLNGDK